MHLRALMLCLLASAACAQSSFPATPVPLEKSTSLECMPVETTDTDRRDPIDKIFVKLVVNDARSPIDLGVVHHAISGASYNRADQYTRSDFRQIPGRAEYYWAGVWNKNPTVTMKGSLAQTAPGRWTYVEEQSRSGIARFWMKSDCRVVSATVPQPDDKTANAQFPRPSDQPSTDFYLAEQHLADCATNADLHPPYVSAQNDVMAVCKREAEAYLLACMASGMARGDHAENECRGAAYTLADSMWKRDPIDMQFGKCLEREAKARVHNLLWPLELVTLCRSERYAFEASCRQRKDAHQCKQDVEELARIAACGYALDDLACRREQ
jgi:hypothetical protein